MPCARQRCHSRPYRSHRSGARDEQQEQPGQDNRANRERAGGDDVTAALRLVERNADEDERLRGHERDCERAPADDEDSEPKRDERPDDRPTHDELTSQEAMPRSAEMRAGSEEPRHEQDAHLRNERLDERERRAEHDEHDGQDGELEPDVPRMG